MREREKESDIHTHIHRRKAKRTHLHFALCIVNLSSVYPSNHNHPEHHSNWMRERRGEERGKKK